MPRTENRKFLILLLLLIVISVFQQASVATFTGPGKAFDRAVRRLSYPLGNGCGHFFNRQLTEESYLISCLVTGDLVRRNHPAEKVTGLNSGWQSGWVTYLLSIVNGKPVIDYVKGFDYWSDQDVDLALKLLKTKYKVDPKKLFQLEQHQKINWRKQCLLKLDNLVKTKLLGHTGEYLKNTDRFENPMNGIFTVDMDTDAYKKRPSERSGQPDWPNVSYLCWHRGKAGFVSEEKVVAVQPFSDGTIVWVRIDGAIFENGKQIGVWPEFKKIRTSGAWLFKGKKYYKLLFYPAYINKHKSDLLIAEFRPKGNLRVYDSPREMDLSQIEIVKSIGNAIITGRSARKSEGRKCSDSDGCPVDLRIFDGETIKLTAKIEYPFYFDHLSSVLATKNHLFYLSGEEIWVTRLGKMDRSF